VRLLTPHGPAGIAIVAVGTDERTAVAKALSTPGGQPLSFGAGRAPVLARLRLDGVELDQLLVVDRGDELELHLHGSPAIVDALAARFRFATRPSTPAERLLQEALDLPQLQLALEQRQWDFGEFLQRLGRLPPGPRRTAVAAALQRCRTALALVRPHRLVLVGRQNAGKSTLLNRLLFRERALTGPLPGLTRDAVRETTCLAGYPYELVDTAGEGAVGTAIDRRALELARAERATADRILVVDGSLGPSAIDRELGDARTLVVASKADLPAAPWPADFPCALALACRDPASAPVVRARLGELLQQRRGLPAAGPVGGPAALDQAQLAAVMALG